MVARLQNQMPDLDPHPKTSISTPIVHDPGVTRVVQRHDDPDGVKLLGRLARTSCSFVILDGPSATVRYALETSKFDAAQIRREFLVVADGNRSEAMSSLRADLGGTGIGWQVCDRVMGGRASVLAEAVEYAANEFLVMSFGVGSQLARIPNLLGHMWIEGADVGVLCKEPLNNDEVGFGEVPDASHRLTEWLGLSGALPEGGLVVMRRWVARWLFNEISRSIDPADELADRARLLGLAIVHLT